MAVHLVIIKSTVFSIQNRNLFTTPTNFFGKDADVIEIYRVRVLLLIKLQTFYEKNLIELMQQTEETRPHCKVSPKNVYKSLTNG